MSGGHQLQGCQLGVGLKLGLRIFVRIEAR